MTFEQWLNKMDRIFLNYTNMDRDFFPDQDYWSMYNQGESPMSAFIGIIEDEYGMEGLEAFGLEEYI